MGFARALTAWAMTTIDAAMPRNPSSARMRSELVSVVSPETAPGAGFDVVEVDTNVDGSAGKLLLEGDCGLHSN
jgi:hypothetical protein